MISRFFKKKSTKTPASKPAPKKKADEPKAAATSKKVESTKILTAEGWRRLMMKKYGSGKKK